MDENDSDHVSESVFSDLDYLSSDSTEFTEDVVQRMGNAALAVEDSNLEPQSMTSSTELMKEVPMESTFDLDLPPEHLYLGNNLESVPGRVILSEGSSVTLPLLPMSYGTLIPGQTFPLTVSDYARIHMIRECVEADHTFGCVATRVHSTSMVHELIGTTAEIYEFADDIGTVRIKAKARQRFKLLQSRRSEKGYFVGECQILPEINLPKPLQSLHCPSLRRFRLSQKERCHKWDSMLTQWPSWVFDQYDTDKLIKRVDKELTFLKQGLRQASGKISMPKDPSELSFWIATHLDAEERLYLIKLNSPIQRLRWQLSLMNKCQQYSCQTCQSVIGYQSDVFAMSIEGAQSTYVNPHGILHETITLRNATNLVLKSNASTEYSWFPGYAWRIAVCKTCKTHIGWQFIADKPRLRPNKFWGLSRQSLRTKITMEGQEESNIPIM